jgi:hypothetical protein
MRSELIFQAIVHESNRYMLCRVIAKGTRALHRPNTRVQETTNAALEHLIHGVSKFPAKHSSSKPIQERLAA